MKPTSPLKSFPMPRLAFRLAMLLLIPLLASCQSGPTRQVLIPPCQGWNQIIPNKADVMVPHTVDQILAHNCHGVTAGCWKAPNAKAASVCKGLK